MFLTRCSHATLWMMPHLVAIALSMIYAWHVSKSAYVQTGVQFVSPLLIILLCHLGFLVLRGKLNPGYASVALGRTAQTTIALIVLIIATEFLGPTPSHADDGMVQSVVMFLVCLAVLAAVLVVAAVILYYVYLILRDIFRWVTGRNKNDGANDLAGIALAIALITGASLEGVPGAYKFAGEGYATASYSVQAPPDAVWNAMQTATSPDFPLPDILQMFPRPTAVLTDEGTVLGANRVVLFEGREGRGKLHLRVVEQSARHARFDTVSQTGPMAHWFGIRSLTYTIADDPAGARLDVRLDYERLLAPSWIFTPMVENAAYLAMSVLAEDTKRRAERRADS